MVNLAELFAIYAIGQSLFTIFSIFILQKQINSLEELIEAIIKQMYKREEKK